MPVAAEEVGADHFRSSAVFLTAAHPKQTEGSDVRPAPRSTSSTRRQFGQDTPLPSIQLVHRERRSAGRVRLQLRAASTSDTDQLGVADHAAADDASTRAWRSRSCSATAARRRTAPPASASTEHPRRHHPRHRAAAARPRRAATRRGSTTTSRASARSSGASRRSSSTTPSGDERELPAAPIGVPDSWEEHVKLMFDLQVLAFAADVTRVSSFKMSRDTSNRVFAESGSRRRSTRCRTTVERAETHRRTTRSSTATT